MPTAILVVVGIGALALSLYWILLAERTVRAIERIATALEEISRRPSP